MKTSGVVFRQNPCFSSNRCYAPCLYEGSRSSSSVAFPRPRFRISPSGFYDEGQLRYYYNNNYSCSSSTAVIRSERITEEKGPMKMKRKKQMKLLKGLSRDLSTISQLGFGLDNDSDRSLVNNQFSEAAELLLEQLQKLKAEKELKKKRKEEKRKLKAAARMQNWNIGGEMSSSSSESSDSECEEVVDINDLKRAQAGKDALKPVIEDPISLPSTATSSNMPVLALGGKDALKPVIENPTSLRSTASSSNMPVLAAGISDEKLNVWSGAHPNLENKCCSGSSGCGSRNLDDLGVVGNVNNLATETSSKKFEVCMGGKCKKFGAAAILEEFQRVVGIEGAVSGCKCMGKCSNGPNVKVLSGYDADDNGVKTPSNPLCIGVGLEDVNTIVANFLGESNREQLSLAVAP